MDVSEKNIHRKLLAQDFWQKMKF